MNKYKIINNAAKLNSGLLQLSADHAKTRIHNLHKVDDDKYEIVREVQFKVGEVIGYEGDLPKNIADLLEDVVQTESKAPSRKNRKDDGDLNA